MRYALRPLTPQARARIAGRGTEMAPFRSTWSSTEDLLERELRMLRATTIVLLIDVTETDIRLDGKLRANARPLSPAVAVQFDTARKGSLLIGCGRYRHWQDNVRAIALGLEALRKVERYGIVRSAEQYEGWRALPEGSRVTVLTDIDRAWGLIAGVAGVSVDAARNDPRTAYRTALKRAHPDNGGTAARFRAVQESALLLGIRQDRAPA